MRSPVVRPPAGKPGYYGVPKPPPSFARPGNAGTAAIPVSAPRTRPVSGPRTRPVSPIPYPGLPASAPPLPAMATAAEVPVHPLTGEPLSDRSSVVAGVLQLLLGWVGAGRLYTGHVAIALAQLGVVWTVAMLMVCGLGAPGLVVLGWLGLVWPAVDGILMLCGGQQDSLGRRLR
jgi:TM2 domain-containing membrane protein YozV